MSLYQELQFLKALRISVITTDRETRGVNADPIIALHRSYPISAVRNLRTR